MARGVSTEWEDVQVKYGNYLARDREETNDEIEKKVIEVLENYDPLDKKNIEQLKELEDDEDEEVLRIYEQKRMEELKQIAQRPKFGTVIEFRKQDYVTEVTNAPKDVFVVCHLYQTWSETSNILSRIFDNLAKKFVFVKFCRIVANNCVENYQDKDVPGIIIYQNGKLYRQFIPATPIFGGSKMNWKKVEWILNAVQVLKSDLENDPFDEDEPIHITKAKPKRDDESDEEDKGDREYRWKISRK